jgi:plasmid stabilization system protein ParE
MDPHSAISGNPPSSGSALAAVSSAAGDAAPHPKWEWATSRIRQRRELCDQRAQAHDARAVFWQQWSAPLAWITAVFAALSAVAVVANIPLAATALSILTAIIAATVAAFQPSEAAKSHRAAATAYERLARKLDDVEALDLGDGKQQIPPEKIEPVRTEITKLDEELNSIELSHPPISSVKRHTYPYLGTGDEHFPRRTVNSR